MNIKNLLQQVATLLVGVGLGLMFSISLAQCAPAHMSWIALDSSFMRVVIPLFILGSMISLAGVVLYLWHHFKR